MPYAASLRVSSTRGAAPRNDVRMASGDVQRKGSGGGPMTGEEGVPMAQAWVRSTGSMADAVQVADLMAVTWEAVDHALRPIIGQRGFTALYQRSLHLNAAVHAWLVDVCQDADKPSDIPALRHAQARQSCAEAVAAGATLLRTFHQLLASLIGSSLTERLLGPAWEESLSHPTHREPQR
jgi:hypothetical protein